MTVFSIFMVAMSILTTSCGIQYSTQPTPLQEDLWTKPEFTKPFIKSALNACGYDERTWSVLQQEGVDTCMLKQNFIFIDSPYGDVHARCKHIQYQHLPSCQSLKNQKK